MQKYFFEVAYKGTNFSGFQKQNNAITIQSELESALKIYYRKEIELTGSSRTDAGVHAKQNFFHAHIFPVSITSKDVYHINALLPNDILLKNIQSVEESMHARFSAISRKYCYYITSVKNPFLQETAYYYPYSLNIQLLNEAASMLLTHQNFQAFCKANTDVKTFNCTIYNAHWHTQDEQLIFTVEANRFLRGMVRGLVGTMLWVGRKKISLENFQIILNSVDVSHTNFNAPASGLFLEKIIFQKNIAIKLLV